MSAPSVSVVMGVRDAAAHVEEAVSGVLAQSLEDFELIIVEDGSTDETPERLLAIEDPRIRMVSQEGSGLTAALIRGVSLARGRYVARQDADDVSSPDRLEKQARFLDEHPEVAVVGSGVRAIDEKGRVLKDYLYPAEHKEIAARLRELVTPVPHPTMLLRADALKRAGGYRDVFLMAQDYDLLLRLARGHLLANLPEPLCALRQREASVSANRDQFLYSVLAMVCDSLFSKTGRDPLETDARDEFLRRFGEWYEGSRYPEIFSSRRHRLKGRLDLGAGRVLDAAVSLGRAFGSDPGWLKRKFLTGESEIADDALGWAAGEGREILDSCAE